MGSRRMDYPSPRGVHVSEAYQVTDPDDPYYRPPSHRNRYSRSTHQTPRIRDVTWVSSPTPVTPQTPHAPWLPPQQALSSPAPWLPPQQVPSSPAPWLPPQQVPSSPAPRPPSAIPPSPVPTVGEHMNVDEFAFVQDEVQDSYSRPRRPGLLRSFWRGLRKLSGYHPDPSFPIPRPSSYVGQPFQVPPLGMSVPSEATQYVDPTPPETSGTEPEEQRSTTPYASPYARPASVRPASVRPASVRATPAVIPGSLRASPVPAPSIDIAPPITVISPSDSPSPRPTSIRSVRMATPGPAKRTLSVGFPEPVGSTEEASQTLHEPVFPSAAQPRLASAPIPVTRSDDDDPKLAFPVPQNSNDIQAPQVDRSSSKGSLASTMARFRRFVAGLDDLPWVSDAQIADEYIPEKNPRSRLRAKVRQGADPSWYNSRPEVAARHEYWSEWDMWAKQSTAALWDGTVWGDGRVGWAGIGADGELGQGQGQGQLWGTAYPHGYVPVRPGFVNPLGYPPQGVLDEEGQAPVIP